MTRSERYAGLDPKSPAGQLLAAGRAEKPESAALHRVSRRLGVPLAALGVASSSTLASASTVATVTSATVTQTGAAALLSTTFVKAIVVGIGIGASTLGTAELVRHSARGHTAATNQQVTVPQQSAPSAPVQLRVHESEREPSQVRTPINSNEESPRKADSRADPVRATSSAFAPKVFPPTSSVDNATRSSIVAQLPSSNSSALPVASSDLQLASEVECLDRARSAVSRGAADQAILALNDFEVRHGFRTLTREVMLVRIEALLSVGRRNEAAAVAKQLLRIGAPATQRVRLESLANSE